MRRPPARPLGRAAAAPGKALLEPLESELAVLPHHQLAVQPCVRRQLRKGGGADLRLHGELGAVAVALRLGYPPGGRAGLSTATVSAGCGNDHVHVHVMTPSLPPQPLPPLSGRSSKRLPPSPSRPSCRGW
ncbi:hypothetical protein GCM10010335_67270 [Streptomyces galbus]|nr:hypothetical protein GCM10010335_67270 [Streptomyces galbus]